VAHRLKIAMEYTTAMRFAFVSHLSEKPAPFPRLRNASMDAGWLRWKPLCHQGFGTDEMSKPPLWFGTTAGKVSPDFKDAVVEKY